MKTQRRYTHWCSILISIGLALSLVWPSSAADTPPTPQQRLERAWQQAQATGVYQYRSQIVQTGYPTPRLQNAGRSPEVERLFVSGSMDRPNNEVFLTLEGGRANQPMIEIKVEDGITYGRQQRDGEWAELDAATDLFASGGDPLGFLSAIENVQEVVDDVQNADTGDPTLEDWLNDPQSQYPDSYTRYTFEIDGPRYARYVTAQMEDQLQRRGSLPVGLRLDLAEQYVKMDAHGEIWLNDAGLPVRQVLHIEFPPERDAYVRYQAEIVTSFWGWGPTALAEDAPTRLPQVSAMGRAAMQMTGMTVGISLLLVALALYVITHYRSRRVYAALALTVALSMVATPLMQANQVAAFYQEQQTRIADNAQQQRNQQAAEQMQDDLVETDFNPLSDPLAAEPLADIQLTAMNSPAAGPVTFSLARSMQASPACPNPVPGDTDCDGNPDDDGDGLTDEVEVVKLGTDPDSVDTDGDRLSDPVEVAGFDLNGQHWYLDPTNPDSNGDGIQDYFECFNLVDVDSDGTWPIAQAGSACENSDGDTTPDVFDFDDDGDGVPDSVDTTRTFTGDLTANAHSSIQLDLSNFNTDKTLLVDLQLRPANPDNLWQHNNVLDWPDDDTSGQITRVLTNTFADVSGESNPLPELQQGDVMLSPVLQIEMSDPLSNTLNPAAGLPISPTFTGSITTSNVAEWLDSEMLDRYGIVVSQDEAGGPLYAYVPLVRVEDRVGETPVAWTARMVYRPEVAAWGETHEVRLLWLVNALVDSCDTSGMSNPDDPAARAAWCADTDHWTTQTSIIQTYYEDFTLTGLDVTEEHSAKTAVIAQTDALTATYHSNLWQLSRGLQSTFLTGDQVGAGTRFAIEEIRQRFDKDTTPYTTGDPSLWDIPDDALIVWDEVAADQTSAMAALQTTVPDLLDATYGSAAANDRVTLLFARENTARSVSLAETELVSINGIVISVNLSDTLTSTHAALNWSPYQYDGTAWRACDVVDYVLENLEPAIRNDLTLADLQTIAGGETLLDADVARDGAVLLAQSYYLSLYRGLAGLVEVGGVIAGENIVDDSAFALGGHRPEVLIGSDMIDLMATLIETDRTILVNGEVVANSDFAATQLRSLLLDRVGFGKERLNQLAASAVS